MKKVFTTCILICCASLLAYGQRMPFFIHYVVNPYLYNPAFTGYEKHPVLQLTHRQQWQRLEAGRTPDPTVSTLQRVARALGVEPGELLLPLDDGDAPAGE